MSSLEKLLARGRNEGLEKGRNEGREQGLWIGKIQMLQGIMNLEMTLDDELENRYNLDFKQSKR